MKILRTELMSRNFREVKVKIGECVCGGEVMLYGFTNTCNCGRDYNMNGQELAPRSQWGEETGESYSDIMQADNDYDNWAMEELLND
jgi:hypothetical protein